MIRRPPRSTLFPTRRSSDLHLAAERRRTDRARGRDLPRRPVRAGAPLALAQAPSGDPLAARARAREVPSLPPSLGRAALQPAVPPPARDPPHALGRPPDGQLVPALPA